MNIEHIHFIVDEPSMEDFLRVLLPRMLGGISFDVFPFQCKNELLERLPERLKGYARWIPETHRIVVLVDRDDDDCHGLKEQLERHARDADIPTRSNPNKSRFHIVNRIVIEELESWYFGDWEAVCAAYPKVKPTLQAKSGYRNPDNIRGGTWEAFERLMKQAGYFKTGLRKSEAAKNIASHFVPERNTSSSFSVFYRAVMELTA